MVTGPVQGSWRDVGRYRLIVEQAKSPLGPLWVANGSSAGDPELVAIRPMATESSLTRADLDLLAEAAWWAVELDHPNILRAIDVVVTEQELATVSEFREGELLRALVSSAASRPAPSAVTLRVALDILEGLSHVDSTVASHPENTSFAHGGLLPDSVLVGSDGQSRLLDVGTCMVAQRIVTLGEHPDVAAYLSPEQVLHRHAERQSVVFSVGVLMWEMLTGRRLFSGPDFDAVVERVTTDSIAPLDGMRPSGQDTVSRAVSDLVTRALARDGMDRFPTSLDMAEAIRSSAGGVLGSHAQVADWVNILCAQSLRSRRSSLESALGIALSALGPTPVRRFLRARPPAEPVPPAPTDLSGTAPELPAARRQARASSPEALGSTLADAQGPSIPRPPRLPSRSKGSAKNAPPDEEATIKYRPGSPPAELVDRVTPNAPEARPHTDSSDEGDELPTTIYRGSCSDPQEEDTALPGPEVLREPAPWARQPFFTEPKPSPPPPPPPAIGRAAPTTPTRPARPVRVRPPLPSRRATAEPSATPPEAAVAASVTAGTVTTPRPSTAASVVSASAATPLPPFIAARVRAQEATLAAAQVATPATIAAEVPVPGPVASAQAPTPVRAQLNWRKIMPTAIAVGVALAGALALASWLRTGKPDVEPTPVLDAPSASAAPPASTVTASGPSAARAQSAAATAPDASASRVAEAPNPAPAAMPEPSEERTAAESLTGRPSTATPSGATPPTAKPVSKPAKKFVPLDL